MLGLSIGKILVIVGVVIALWRGYRLLAAFRDAQDRLGRAAEDRRQRERVGGGAAAAAAPSRAAPARPTELVECPRCGTFVPNGTLCPSVEGCLVRKPAA